MMLYNVKEGHFTWEEGWFTLQVGHISTVNLAYLTILKKPPLLAHVANRLRVEG